MVLGRASSDIAIGTGRNPVRQRLRGSSPAFSKSRPVCRHPLIHPRFLKPPLAADLHSRDDPAPGQPVDRRGMNAKIGGEFLNRHRPTGCWTIHSVAGSRHDSILILPCDPRRRLWGAHPSPDLISINLAHRCATLSIACAKGQANEVSASGSGNNWNFSFFQPGCSLRGDREPTSRSKDASSRDRKDLEQPKWMGEERREIAGETCDRRSDSWKASSTGWEKLVW